MARVVPAFTIRSGPAKYDWAKWSDGRIWRIQQGIDFDRSVASMGSTIRNRANLLGLGVRAMTDYTAKAIEFQFFKRDE